MPGLEAAALSRHTTMRKLREKTDYGVLIGLHGTSASRALLIMENGFKDHESVRGLEGVYFWGQEHPEEAMRSGYSRALAEGENDLAIIEAELYRPAQDIERPETAWWSLAADIGIKAVQYYYVSENSNGRRRHQSHAQRTTWYNSPVLATLAQLARAPLS